MHYVHATFDKCQFVHDTFEDIDFTYHGVDEIHRRIDDGDRFRSTVSAWSLRQFVVVAVHTNGKIEVAHSVPLPKVKTNQEPPCKPEPGNGV